MASIVVDGLELLSGGPDDGPLGWGCYPMVPWPGRLDRGILRFDGAEHRFPLAMPPHAIHGTTWDRPWTVIDRSETTATLHKDLARPWPFGGHAIHRVTVADTYLRLDLEVHAGAEPMPAACGWHPWFRRNLDRGGAAQLDFGATHMWERGGDGLPTGELMLARPGPWDDCFPSPEGPPTVIWPDAIALRIESDCPQVVVYDEQDRAVCIEPQTLIPNGLNRNPPVLQPGEHLAATCSLRWSSPGTA